LEKISSPAVAGIRILDVPYRGSMHATPKERLDRLGTAIRTIMQSPEITEKFAALGAIPRALGPAEFGAFLASEDARWGAVVKSSGVTIE
jgi:tripartite-type tricarboxylate transporter receptor subunit TctC